MKVVNRRGGTADLLISQLPLTVTDWSMIHVRSTSILSVFHKHQWKKKEEKNECGSGTDQPQPLDSKHTCGSQL